MISDRNYMCKKRVVSFLILCSVACNTNGQERHYWARSTAAGLELETWLESSTHSWDTLEICCRLTNRSAAVHTASFAFEPPFTVYAFDRHGIELKPSDHVNRYFVIPGRVYFSSFEHELAPGDSFEKRIPLTKAFIASDPGNGVVRVTWSPNLIESMAGLMNELQLPEKPMVIAPPPEVRRDKTPAVTDRQVAGKAANDAVPPSSASKPPSATTSVQPRRLNDTTRHMIPWLAWAIVILAVLGLLWLRFKRKR